GFSQIIHGSEAFVSNLLYKPSDQQDCDCRRQRDTSRCYFVAANELLQTIYNRRRAGLNWFIIEISLQVYGYTLSCFVATIAILFETLHNDPIELAANILAQSGRLDVAIRGDG